MRLMIWALAHNGRGGMTPIDGEFVPGTVHADTHGVLDLIGPELDDVFFLLVVLRPEPKNCVVTLMISHWC